MYLKAYQHMQCVSKSLTLSFLQRVSIACYAERCRPISYDRFCPSVWPSLCHTLV